MSYADGTLYTELTEGTFLAVDIQSRRVLWTFEDPSLGKFVAPAILARSVFVMALTRDRGSQIVALDRVTGKSLWRYSFVEVAYSPSPVVCDGRVIIGDYKQGRAVALDAQSGVLSWDTSGSPYHFFHPPTVSGGSLLYVVKTRGGEHPVGLAKISCTTGKSLELVSLNLKGISRFPIFLLDDRHAILSAHQSHSGMTLTRVDLDSKRVLWTSNLPTDMAYPPVLEGNRLFFGSGDVWGVTLDTGHVFLSLHPKVKGSSFVVSRDSLIYQVGPLAVRAVDAESATTRWEARLKEPISSNLVLCGETICVRSGKRTLVMLQPQTGATVGSIELKPLSAPN